MPFRLALALLGWAVLAPSVQAQTQGPATVYCINDRIRLESDRMQSRDYSVGTYGNAATICVIGPRFGFPPDAVTWVRQNLRQDVGGSCSCR